MSTAMRPPRPGPPESRGSRATPIIVALSVVVCIAVVVAIAIWVNDSDDTGNASTETSTPTSPEACAAPPALPAEPMSFDAPPDPADADGATWVASVATTCGTITLELDGADAPQTVASFNFLSEQGYFDDSPCHRLVTTGIFVLQCGDPTGTGSGGPGYSFGMENAPEDGVYPRGTLAMARTSDPNSNGSQFFIVYKKSSIPDPTGYSIFGKVTEGMDIVDAIAAEGLAKDGTAPAQPISILGVTVEEG